MSPAIYTKGKLKLSQGTMDPEGGHEVCPDQSVMNQARIGEEALFASTSRNIIFQTKTKNYFDDNKTNVPKCNRASVDLNAIQNYCGVLFRKSKQKLSPCEADNHLTHEILCGRAKVWKVSLRKLFDFMLNIINHFTSKN